MGNLLLILAILFVVLVAVVKLVEKNAKPMDPEQQLKLSRLAMILIALLLVGGLIQAWVS